MISPPTNAPQQISPDRLIGAFRACLLALLPHMDVVGVEWRDGKAYDDWDRIEEALFQSVVSTPIEFTPSEGASRPLQRYKFAGDPEKFSTIFDEELGETYEFFCLEQVSIPFDTARFQSKEGEDILKAVTECRFIARLQASRSTDTVITNLVNIS